MNSTSSYIILTSLSSLALISLVMYKRNKKEAFSSKTSVKFIDTHTAKTFIEIDADNYVKLFSLQDLRARHVNTITEYIEKSSQDVIPFNKNQKNIINKNIILANQFLDRQKHYFIDPLLLNKIHWKFILTKGFYESGLPHTRGPYIFLASNYFDLSSNDQVITLIHEKIHLYQRFYQKDFQKMLLENGYSIHGFRKEIKNIRANPDVDQYVYINPLKQVMVATYKNNYPKNIQDIDTTQSVIYEHPYEEIAYKLSKSYSSL